MKKYSETMDIGIIYGFFRETADLGRSSCAPFDRERSVHKPAASWAMGLGGYVGVQREEAQFVSLLLSVLACSGVCVVGRVICCVALLDMWFRRREYKAPASLGGP